MRCNLSSMGWLLGISLFAFCLLALAFPFQLAAQAPLANPGDVVINEVAWGGTAASPNHEWMELYNATDQAISLTGWSLVAIDGTPVISLAGTVPAGGYLLLERTSDSVVSDLPADVIYTGALDNDGEGLQLLDPDGRLIDSANLDAGAWPAGSGSPDYVSMERVNPLAPDTPDNWTSNSGITCNGYDANGQPLVGTPGQANSTMAAPPTPTPPPNTTDTPTPMPTWTVTATLPPTSTTAPPPAAGAVVINEIAWGGTAANAADEWIELFNTRSQATDLTGWRLAATDGQPVIALSGIIPPGGYFLLERTDDSTIPDIPADLFYTGGLGNQGETLQLLAPDGSLIDSANLAAGPWPAGSGSPDYASMERVDPLAPDTPDNWASNNGLTRNGLDASGNPLNGTPKQLNSTYLTTPTPTPAATATSMPTASPTVTPMSTSSPISTPTLFPTPAPTSAPPPGPGQVVVNEVAWGGTAANAADEWIELYNTTDLSLSLTGLSLAAMDGQPTIALSGIIPPGGYFLLERTDDSTIPDIPADLLYTGGLGNQGETLQLLAPDGTLIDSANLAAGPWPAGSGSPDYASMERVDPLVPDIPSNWASNNGMARNGLDASGNPINGTPKQLNSVYLAAPAPTASPTPVLIPSATPTPTTAPPAGIPPKLLISEFLYDASSPTTSGDEFVEICNADGEPVDLTGFKVGDEESRGESEGMYYLPEGRMLAPEECLLVAKNAAQFVARFGTYPDGELVASGAGYSDTLSIPNLARYSQWASGTWALADDGDEVLLLDPADQLVDSVAYGAGDYAAAGVSPAASAREPNSLQRIWPLDSDCMTSDFVRTEPSPGSSTPLPAAPVDPPPAADLPGGMAAYWGILHSHSTYSDGAGPPILAFASARANGLHFLALTDHASQLTEDEWADLGGLTGEVTVPAEFVGLRGFEYTHPSDGHITVWNTDSFASRDEPEHDTLSELYAWLADQPNALAEFNHPFEDSDFQDFAYQPDAASILALLEVGNGTQTYGQYNIFEEQWLRALAAGWHLAPANNSDSSNAHWGADTLHRTGLVAPALTQADLLDAVRARRAFATEDANLALTLRSGDTWMGSSVASTTTLNLTINAIDLDPISEPITLTLYDRTLPLASATFVAPAVEWMVAIPGQAGHFYWARAQQADGDVAQTAPLWAEGELVPEQIVLNEVLPAPNAVDWDGDGKADYQDEWAELYNAGGSVVGLGSWRLEDAAGATYLLPLDATLQPGEYGVFYRRQTGLALNNDNESLILRRPDGTIADSYTYGDGPSYDVSLCRLPDARGDWQIRCEPTPGGSNHLLPVAAPIKASVFDVRHMDLDSWVKIRGHVTVPPGVFDQRTAYIQDQTGGIKIYLPQDHRLSAAEGEHWEVVGHTRLYYGEMEIRVSQRGDVHTLESGQALPPLPINTGVMVEPYEGTLVMLSGWAVDFERGGPFWIDDGSGWARVYLDRDTHISRPWLEIGQPLQIVGVVSQYAREDSPAGSYRLMPRYASDLVIQAEPDFPGPGWPALLPETGKR